MSKVVIIMGSKADLYSSLRMPSGEIAANLFSALHTLEDDENIKQIFIEPVLEIGLGIAIMDRIKKAAYKYQKNN